MPQKEYKLGTVAKKKGRIGKEVFGSKAEFYKFIKRALSGTRRSEGVFSSNAEFDKFIKRALSGTRRKSASTPKKP